MQKFEMKKTGLGRVAAVALLLCPVAVAVSGAQANDPVQLHLEAEFTVEGEGMPDAWIMVDPSLPVHEVFIWSDGVDYEPATMVEPGVWMAQAIRVLTDVCYDVHAEVLIGHAVPGAPAAPTAMKKVKHLKKAKHVKKIDHVKKVKHAKKVKKVKGPSHPAPAAASQILLDLSTVRCPNPCDAPQNPDELG